MEGRWTIHTRGWGHLVAPTDPKDVTPGSWPVVPCDDAAIERAVAAVFEVEAYYSPRRLRELFEIGLRAAGATP